MYYIGITIISPLLSSLVQTKLGVSTESFEEDGDEIHYIHFLILVACLNLLSVVINFFFIPNRKKIQDALAKVAIMEEEEIRLSSEKK